MRKITAPLSGFRETVYIILRKTLSVEAAASLPGSLTETPRLRIPIRLLGPLCEPDHCVLVHRRLPPREPKFGALYKTASAPTVHPHPSSSGFSIRQVERGRYAPHAELGLSIINPLIYSAQARTQASEQLV